MQDEKKKPGPPQTGPDTINDPDFYQSDDERESSRLERLLEGVQTGWKITIYRVAPSWCRGHLETYDVYDPGESIDIDHLTRRWGGQKLHVKVSRQNGQWVGGGSIPLYSYPPKVRGEPIQEQDFISAGEGPQKQALQPYPYPNQQPAQSFDFGKILDLITKGKSDHLALALKLLDRTGQTAPQQQINPMGGMLEQMGAMFQIFGQMQEMFGGGGDGGADGGDPDSIMPILGQVAQSLLGQQQQQTGPGPQLPKRRSVVAPGQQSRAVGPPPTQGPRSVPGPATAPDQEPETDHDTLPGLADKLSSMSPQDAAEIVTVALGNMPEDKREQAMQAFLENMRPESDLDGSSNSDDTYYQDDDDPSAPDDPKNPDTRR